MSVRLAGPDDLAAAQEVLGASGTALARMASRPDLRVVVAVEGGEVVGVAVVGPPRLDDDEAEVVALRGRGQDGLVAEAARQAADLGALRVRMPVGPWVPVPPAGDDLVDRFLRLAARAGLLASGTIGAAAGGPVSRKPDGSVSIDADAAADRVATEVFAELDVALLSEEHADPALARSDAPWIVVDPLDGTGNFLAGLPPWAFSAGLVAGGRVVAGFVMDMASGRRWSGAAGRGAWRDGRPIRPRPGSTTVVPTPPPGAAAPVPEGSRRLRITGCTAVDLCLVADGSAAVWHDLDRAGTHVHDVAGALGVLAGAGGVVLGPDGEDLPLRPDTGALIRFVAAADDDTARRLLAAHP
ncbi:hypothetical protein PO878_09350 [Iamia majanohamensis]|uniref:Inositol monophosphatase n=1 Tax=Iamia majanohamensis TaxID=467976 RepID=A0AAE9YCZ2_9ACTN|nr:inositol monophosphatase family protein [Iamia majanohamensis]WCO68928.1 hypothetical protein PO878_09350 [Iamia majanohamensis]